MTGMWRASTTPGIRVSGGTLAASLPTDQTKRGHVMGG